MKIAKEYRWEMGHRLPFHKGLCKNVHGHSYRMIVEVTGTLDKNGMVIDFFDLNKIVNPIIEKYDHAFLCWEKDETLRYFLIENKMKNVIVRYHSTVENICNDFSQKIAQKLQKIKGNSFHELTVKIYETPNAYAENTRILNENLTL